MRDPIVPLSTLGKYAHVIWMTDQEGANNTSSQFDRVKPITSLREMNKRNRSNTLATYMRLGGRAWLLGGGIAKASLAEWENRQGASTNFTARDLELVPGRMMFDFPHWQTEVTAGASGSVARVGGRLAVDPVNQPGVFRVDPPGRGWVGQPNYSLLPPVLERKGVSSTTPPDPLPPLRTSQPGAFYQNFFWDESLFAPNFIREDLNGPALGGVESTLDTLYHYFTTSGGGGGATMTYYHGLETGAPVMFSGFPLWFPKRDQVIQLTDFVLHDVWGLVRQAVPRAPNFVRPRAPVSARTAPGVRKPTAVAAGASAATTPRPATLAPAPRGAPLRSEN
jgi:hypothetical protein